MDGRMKIVIAVLLVASVGLTEGRKRTKRNLIQLAEQLKSLTGRDPLDFNGYGCYCGWGGSGTPVDEADRCCKNHDDCYGNVSNDLHGCEPKWTEYKWNIDRNIGRNIDRKSILCLDQANAMIFKPTSSQNCQRRICECDKALSECLNKSPYNKDNYELDKKQRC